MRRRAALAVVTAAVAVAAAVAGAQARAAERADPPNLELAAGAVSADARVGDRLTYVLTATNTGTGEATAVLVTATLRGPGSFVSGETSRGACAATGVTLTCALGTLAPDATATTTIRAQTSGPGTLEVRFALGEAQQDADPADGIVVRSTRVQLRAEPVALPAAGPVLWRALTARAAPREDAPRILTFPEFRRDLLPQVVLALAERTDDRGRLWYRVELPMRPNGRTGWIRGDGVGITPVRRRVLVDRSLRRLTVFAGSRVLMRTRVAVGRPGMETPLGNFYVTAKFKPSEPILGAYAIETSAYSRLTEWPGGGIVGIHGTPMPWLLGRAVSHGCIRVANAAIERVAGLVPVGTPVQIVA